MLVHKRLHQRGKVAVNIIVLKTSGDCVTFGQEHLNGPTVPAEEVMICKLQITVVKHADAAAVRAVYKHAIRLLKPSELEVYSICDICNKDNLKRQRCNHVGISGFWIRNAIEGHFINQQQ